MTNTEIHLVKDSFRRILPIADQAAALFYARLFELDPALRRFAGGDMREQGRHLMTLIATAVQSLEQIENLVPAVRRLGARHAVGGVTAESCAVVGTALLWALEKCLGPAFAPAVRDAWASTCALLATTLVETQPAAA